MLHEADLDCDAMRSDASVAVAASHGTASRAPCEVEDADGRLADAPHAEPLERCDNASFRLYSYTTSAL